MRIRTVLSLGLFFWLGFVPSPSFADSYVIDKDHSSVSFEIKHLLSKVRGQFTDFEGTFDFVPNQSAHWKIEATVQASSINTNNEKRDNHLKSPDFFDTNQHKTLRFLSKKVLSASPKKAKIEGDLTIHGITKPVVLDVELLGTSKDPWGNEKFSASAKTKINRKDFGLNWNKALETGGFLVGEDVEIQLDIEGNKQAKK